MNKVQIQLIKECLDCEHEMSEWENEFINNIANHEEDYELSKKQNEVLNRINQKIN